MKQFREAMLLSKVKDLATRTRDIFLLMDMAGQLSNDTLRRSMIGVQVETEETLNYIEKFFGLYEYDSENIRLTLAAYLDKFPDSRRGESDIAEKLIREVIYTQKHGPQKDIDIRETMGLFLRELEREETFSELEKETK